MEGLLLGQLDNQVVLNLVENEHVEDEPYVVRPVEEEFVKVLPNEPTRKTAIAYSWIMLSLCSRGRNCKHLYKNHRTLVVATLWSILSKDMVKPMMKKLKSKLDGKGSCFFSISCIHLVIKSKVITIWFASNTLQVCCFK